MIEQKLRYMYEMAADGVDPEYNRVLLEAANEIARLCRSLQQIAAEQSARTATQAADYFQHVARTALSPHQTGGAA